MRRSSAVPAGKKLAATGLVSLFVLLATGGPVSGENVPLPLGASDLPETRTVQELAPGVSLTRISRGTGTTAPKDYQTTKRGPWQVQVVTIDPTVATGHLRSSYGTDLAGTEPVSQIAALTGAMAAVNASYFTFTASSSAPGDPVGLGMYDGTLISEPSSGTAEVSMLVDARTNQVTFPGKLSWWGRMTNTVKNKGIKLDALGHPPFVPPGCEDLKKPVKCKQTGQVVLLTPHFASKTPSGAGVEVVLNRKGCVYSKSKERGTKLKPRQTAIQATGRKTLRLLKIAKLDHSKGCFERTESLTDSTDTPVPTGPWMYGVNGRFALTRAGVAVVPNGQTSLFERHPRTFVGRTSAGQIRIVTIDGRQPTSVGVRLREAAQVALALDMPDAINLDGGGSTTMVVNGALANSPSGGRERAVGDGLVYVPTPYVRKR